jgi:hypothetical protein
MCPCSPIDSGDVILPDLPAGFGGLPVPQLPNFDIPFPNLPIEDLLNLFNTINMILPPGILRPNLSSNFSKDVLDAILSLLEKFMPFLMMYTFFMPVLNMILCIIEVLCAINNPYKLVKALVRLFRVCIPEFLALFPFFALILMILSLLLLILALILYLIQRILDLIRQIIQNIEMLAQAVSSVDNDSVIAITIKLGDLLCIFQNVFVLLGVILLIFQVIERLLTLSFKLPPCDDSDGSDDGCCTPDVCPSFIKNNKEIISSTGTLQYYNKVILTGGLLGPVTLRESSFQLYDVSAPVPLQFNNITHAFDMPEGVTQVFFPEGETYGATTTPNRVPYTVDLRFYYDPALFGRTDDLGARFIKINNCIVLRQPVDGVSDYQNNLVEPFNGTVFIAGGTAYEDDGITIMKVSPSDDAAGTLDTVVRLDDSTEGVVTSSDGIIFDQITYTFKINHNLLVGKSLITLGCHPDVSLNKNFINSTIGAQLNANATALGNITLPDVQATQECVINAVNTFRQSVSVESAQALQSTVLDCLNKLKDDTNTALEAVVNAGFDPFKSDFEVDPGIQFTTKPINVIVTLNEAGGNNIANNLPAEVAANLAANLAAEVTLGNINDFSYDGSSNFIAQITSEVAGNGMVKVSYNNQFISILDNPIDIAELPTVSTKELLYTFVQSPAITIGTGGEAGAVRRDEGDVARDGSGNGG